MQVILTDDVSSLGEGGEIVDVSSGYFRNFLAPKRLAVVLTEGALADRNKRLARIQAKAEKKHAEDQAKADKVTSIGQLSLTARAGEHGKLYGAVTTKELAKLISDKTGMNIERKMLDLSSPINRLGEYDINVKFSSKVSAPLHVLVEAEADDTVE